MKYSTAIHFRAEADLAERLRLEAERNGESLSAVIRERLTIQQQGGDETGQNRGGH